MQSQNKYIGDDKMQKMLDHYHCEMPLEAVKMRFAGAVCSPNMELRPTDVISSLWPENREPRLQTKEEAELFFKFFMGLWDEIFEQVRHNEVRLPPTCRKLPVNIGASNAGAAPNSWNRDMSKASGAAAAT